MNQGGGGGQGCQEGGRFGLKIFMKGAALRVRGLGFGFGLGSCMFTHNARCRCCGQARFRAWGFRVEDLGFRPCHQIIPATCSNLRTVPRPHSNLKPVFPSFAILRNPKAQPFQNYKVENTRSMQGSKAQASVRV